MLKLIAALPAVALALALGPASVESRDQDDPLQFSLNCKPPSFKNRRPLIVFNGTCALPDGVILKVNLSRVAEAVAGTMIQPTYFGEGNGTAEIGGKKFIYDTHIDGPAKYNVQISLVEDLQQKHLVPELRKKAGAARTWQREFLVWGDELIGELAPKLNEVHELITECREIVKKFEKASTSQQTWAADSKPLVAEGTKLMGKLEHHPLQAYYPAAVNNLYYSIRNVVNNAPYYTFGPDGKFSGARDYHADGEKVKTYRGEEFNWENLKRYIEDSLPIAGREFCLWIVKDIRRTGVSRPEIVEAVKAAKAAPGVDFFQERLQKASISDIDVLEAEIRGTKGGAPPSKPDGDSKSPEK
jgi:hypothetical protein